MSGKITRILLSIFTLMLSLEQVQAQDRCATTQYELERKAKRPNRESPAQFEQWMQSKVGKVTSNPPQIAAVYTIPVVVHVIHNGVGDITHISTAQVLSQIDVLNKDFNRLNLDATSTPAEFQPVAGSLDIEFALATRTPEGLATNGIIYTQGTKTEWTLDDQSEFKALSYWPAEDYLNIWVINFGTAQDIGFAQFPVTNNLSGLEMASEDRLTDGVVVDYRAFGTSDAGSFPLMARFDKGRTATHEIGHFFGLRHIWGDTSTCGDNDFVSDTPPQTGPSSFCPIYPQASCSSNKMFMNYMDYTDDRCMNIYTDGQVARMLVVLSESPRRLSLTTSLGATPVVVATNDLGIRSILSPAATSCLNSVSPQLEVRNYGSNTITSAQIELVLDGTPTQTKNVVLSLAPDQITTVTFDPISLPAGSSHQFDFTITQTNGVADGNVDNNDVGIAVAIPNTIALPVVETFATVPAAWTIVNPDNQIGWTNVIAPDNSPTNRAMKMDFYFYENEGLLDWLVTPAFTLPTPSTSQLRFDLAYAQFSGQPGDALRVYALPGCNPDLSQAILLYDKGDAALATTSSTSNPFTPTSAAQWRKSEVLTLASLNNSVPWQLAFVSRNGYGNNLYLDNVVLTENEISDIVLVGVVSPGIVHCLSNPIIKFQVANLGTSAVNSFTMEYTVNGGALQTQLFSSVQLDVGETETFSLNPVSIQPGVNQVVLTVSLPNGIPDILSNNVFTLTSVLDQSVDRGPLRMTFDNPREKSWRVASPAGTPDWEAISTNKDQSLAYRSFTNPSVGQESWLVSPSLDLTLSAYSMFFDVSYAQNMPADDRLLILASTDCGVNYDQVIMDRAASSFTSASSSNEWYPGSNDDWRREYIDISAVAGQDNVRLAFVALNDNGNNLFIDNIELFEGTDPNPPITSATYQFYYTSANSQSDVAVTFNLPARQDVALQIYSMQGALVGDYVLPETLNQTYYYDMSGQTAGIYLFRLLIDNQPSVTKVFIGH